MPFHRVAVIYNPTSGRAGRHPGYAAALQTALQAASVKTALFPTAASGDAARLAAAAVAAGADLVVAFGGDGTVNEVVQSLVGTTTALAVWPGGTANVLAHDLHMPALPAPMARRILGGDVRPVTVGLAATPDGDRRYFLAMAGAGLDAAVVAGVRTENKRRLGKAAFLLEAAYQLLWWQPVPFRLRWRDSEGNSGEATATTAIFGNTPSYGGGLRITPTATLTAPSLVLCTLGAASPAVYVPAMMAAVAGQHRGRPDVTYVTVTSVTAEPLADAVVPVQLDGEAWGRLPLRIEVLPQGVRLLH